MLVIIYSGKLFCWSILPWYMKVWSTTPLTVFCLWHYSCQQWWYGSWPRPLHIWCARSRYESFSLIPRLPHSGTQTLNLCRCREPGIFWAFGYPHVQLKSFYPFYGAHMRKNTRLSMLTNSMFVFQSVGAWERGYETSSCTYTVKNCYFSKLFVTTVVWLSFLC